MHLCYRVKYSINIVYLYLFHNVFKCSIFIDYFLYRCQSFKFGNFTCMAVKKSDFFLQYAFNFVWSSEFYIMIYLFYNFNHKI